MGVMGAVSIVHAISSRSEGDHDALSTEDYNQVKTHHTSVLHES